MSSTELDAAYYNKVLEAHRQETLHHNLLHQQYMKAALYGNLEEYGEDPYYTCPCKWCAARRQG